MKVGDRMKKDRIEPEDRRRHQRGTPRAAALADQQVQRTHGQDAEHPRRYAQGGKRESEWQAEQCSPKHLGRDGVSHKLRKEKLVGVEQMLHRTSCRPNRR